VAQLASQVDSSARSAPAADTNTDLIQDLQMRNQRLTNQINALKAKIQQLGGSA
jgi:uncharacterized protein YceH (UPF0502 family)